MARIQYIYKFFICTSRIVEIQQEKANQQMTFERKEPWGKLCENILLILNQIENLYSVTRRRLEMMIQRRKGV